ncbi:MAG: hypothetical protein H0Z39_10530, partial [Peptococcaceae bacterium]|nr:hypothetical protein [Peptococcaceae bacterium]
CRESLFSCAAAINFTTYHLDEDKENWETLKTEAPQGIGYIVPARLKRRINEVKETLKRLPAEEKTYNPLDLHQDYRGVALSHLIHLLETQYIKTIWQLVREPFKQMSPAARRCAETYLNEEVHEPFFGSELPDIYLTPDLYLDPPARK